MLFEMSEPLLDKKCRVENCRNSKKHMLHLSFYCHVKWKLCNVSFSFSCGQAGGGKPAGRLIMHFKFNIGALLNNSLP